MTKIQNQYLYCLYRHGIIYRQSNIHRRSNRKVSVFKNFNLIILLMVAITLGCSKPPKAQKITLKTGNRVTLENASLQFVRVEKAETPPPTASHPLFGRVTFDERKLALLGSPVNGRVSLVSVSVGSPVRVGQPLVTIRSSDVAAANAQLSAAKHNRMLAAQAAARAMQLANAGAGTEAERQQAETALKNAEAEERRAMQTAMALGLTTTGSDYVLRSPIQGTVVDKQITVGNTVAADQGSPFITIADLSSVWVSVDVYEQDIPYVKIGHTAKIYISSLRDRVYESTISYVGDVIDTETRTARARIILENKDGLLRPGMFAQVDVKSPEIATAWIPSSALLARRDEFFVYVHTEKNTFDSRKVEIGQEHGDHVSIVSGLKAGEEVVTRGAILLDAEANSAF